VVVVNTARGEVGDNVAALIGSTLLNLMTFEVASQARIAAPDRRPVSLFVDEFHTIPGADYEGMLAELNKFGANLVLATQSLSRLASRDDGASRDLRATVFANLDGLFAFNCSAEDAEYLVPELGGALDVQDLVELGEHQCYVRLSSAGRRLPTFSVRLDPPAPADAAKGAAVARRSAEQYGRPASEVAAQLRTRMLVQTKPSVAEPVPPARNQHRPRKKRNSQRLEIIDAAS
jgi:hypothetical protein